MALGGRRVDPGSCSGRVSGRGGHTALCLWHQDRMPHGACLGTTGIQALRRAGVGLVPTPLRKAPHLPSSGEPEWGLPHGQRVGQWASRQRWARAYETLTPSVPTGKACPLCLMAQARDCQVTHSQSSLSLVSVCPTVSCFLTTCPRCSWKSVALIVRPSQAPGVFLSGSHSDRLGCQALRLRTGATSSGLSGW